jgi:hypothetical protein
VDPGVPFFQRQKNKKQFQAKKTPKKKLNKPNRCCAIAIVWSRSETKQKIRIEKTIS